LYGDKKIALSVATIIIIGLIVQEITNPDWMIDQIEMVWGFIWATIERRIM
jgi:hypothetical protein